MDQRIDQQFDDRRLRHFQKAQRIEVLVALNVMQIALDEGEAALVLLQQRAVDVLAVQIVVAGQ